MPHIALDIAFASAGLAVFLFFVALFSVALVRRDNTIADIGWGIGGIIAAMAVLWQRDGVSLLQAIITTLVAAWGVRLSLHIWLRSRGKGEDRRYRDLRRRWGSHWIAHSFLQVFLPQAIALVIVAAPVIYVNAHGKAPFGLFAFVGLGIWFFGFVWETVADHQLVRFKRLPGNKGRIMTTGLWKYSRHPNYFGELGMWWGLYVMALSVSGAWPTAVGPLLLTYLIVRVTGIPPLEQCFASNPEYLAYQEKTNALIPWFSSR